MAKTMGAGTSLACPVCRVEVVVPRSTACARQPLEHLGEDHHRVVYKTIDHRVG